MVPVEQLASTPWPRRPEAQVKVDVEETVATFGSPCSLTVCVDSLFVGRDGTNQSQNSHRSYSREHRIGAA